MPRHPQPQYANASSANTILIKGAKACHQDRVGFCSVKPESFAKMLPFQMLLLEELKKILLCGLKGLSQFLKGLAVSFKSTKSG